MHEEILTSEQKNLVPVVDLFTKDFGLVGGTAIALHLGHRRSIDFDLFTEKEFDNQAIRRKIRKSTVISEVLRDEVGQYTFVINNVQFTFFNYPYHIEYKERFGRWKLPDLLTLAAMKAFALGQRAKWKDYVDLYFIMKSRYSLSEISQKGRDLFGGEFNEKLFRTQLGYFDDINYSEAIEYLPGVAVSDETIKKSLIDFSLP